MFAMAKVLKEVKVCGDLAYVELSRGFIATIDACDIGLVDGVNWYALVVKDTVYAVRSVNHGGKRTSVLMHRIIAGSGPKDHTDHADRNGLNNRRSNLRVSTKSQNMQNRKMASHNKSGAKGVSWHKENKKWRANIRVNGKAFHLGYHDTVEAAHEAYAAASMKFHGQYGRIT